MKAIESFHMQWIYTTLSSIFTLHNSLPERALTT
jgi:hypothetical protein